jgi:hypothetical protein
VKALTVKQPWADAIVHGSKRTENRTWTTKQRGQILIHAGAAYDPMGRFIITDRAALDSWPDARKAIIGVAELIDVHAAADGCCEPWGEPNVYHWQLANIQPLIKPVPATGRLQFWTPADGVLAAVVAQLEVVR